MINIAERMREVLPILKKGIGSVMLSSLKPECEETWNEEYAVVDGLYYTSDYLFNITDDYCSFDEDRFKLDYEEKVKSYFPDCTVKFHWKSQEIEVYRD